jgi:hypothetical protein
MSAGDKLSDGAARIETKLHVLATDIDDEDTARGAGACSHAPRFWPDSRALTICSLHPAALEARRQINPAPIY